jgi:hypothetical protein
MDIDKFLDGKMSDAEFVGELVKMLQEHRNPRRPIEEVEFIYCLVGNILPCHYLGEEKKIVRGTSHFAANAKVFVFPRIGNYKGERVRVVGFSRKLRKYHFTRMRVELITNWRLKKVYTKRIIEIMYENDGWRDTEIDRDSIISMIPWLSELTEKEVPFRE